MTRNTGLLSNWSLTGAGGLYLERGGGGVGGGTVTRPNRRKEENLH